MKVSLDDETDEELMTRYQGGDHASFDALYARYSKKIYGFLHSKTGNRANADDLFSKVFLKLHQARHQYSNAYLFKSWLFTIARNSWLDFLRSQYREGENVHIDSLHEELVAPEKEVSTHEHESLTKALTYEQKNLLNLKYNEGLSFEEISQRLNIAPASARQRMSRLIRFIRNSIQSKEVKS